MLVFCVLGPVCIILAIVIYSLGGFITVINVGKGNACIGTGNKVVLLAVVSSAPVVSWGGECKGSFVWDDSVREIWWF